MRRSSSVTLLALACVFAASASAQAATESLVTVGSPTTPFPQNKQNEPGLAVDPANPTVLAAGSNEEIDEPACDGSDCPFVQGIGNSGIYFSFNGGASWAQPTYPGYSGRDGTPGPGPIGTLPHYDTNGLVSDGDPGLVFGPAPDAQGHFAWANGSRLYYSNLTSNFSTVKKDFTFKGFEAIAVSHADNVQAAAGGDASSWSDPAIVTTARQSTTTFSDKPGHHVGQCRVERRSSATPTSATRSSRASRPTDRPRSASAARPTVAAFGRGRSRSAHLITTADLRARAGRPPGLQRRHGQQGERLRGLGGLGSAPVRDAARGVSRWRAQLRQGPGDCQRD